MTPGEKIAEALRRAPSKVPGALQEHLTDITHPANLALLAAALAGGPVTAALAPFLGALQGIESTKEFAEATELAGRAKTEGELEEAAKKYAEAVAKYAAAVAAAKLTGESLQRASPGGHVFDRHAHEWFGVSDAASFRPSPAQVREWIALIERVGRSNTSFRWSVGGSETVAHLAKINGKWFVVQRYKDTGTLASAFIPKGEQLAAMLRAAGLK